MSESTTGADLADGFEAGALEELEAAQQRLEQAQRRIEDAGEDAVEAAAEAYERGQRLLDDYVDRATGTGRENFKAYVQLKGQFEALAENAPEEVDEPFEAAFEAIDKRRLHESDFERAEAALEPAGRYAELIDEREAAREALSEARANAHRRLREIDEEVEDRERLLAFADADFDAPIERLREPIEAYNEAIATAFEHYRRSASARELFAFLERTRWYPFVEYEHPPPGLESYVREHPVGEQPIPTLLEYADYSRSKLEHYVDDAGELKRHVATEQTFLDGIDAEALRIPWPPERAGALRRRTRELVPLAARVVDGAGGPGTIELDGVEGIDEVEGVDEVDDAGADPVVLVRTVRRLTYGDDYERLRSAAVAIERTTEDERRRLAAGRVADELEHLRTEREALQAALEDGDAG